MRRAERLISRVRHSQFLGNADWLWNTLRPAYDEVVSLLGRNGIQRKINGTDSIVVGSWHRGMSEEYEPDVWRSLMEEIRSGDVFVDVGSFIGLYTIAIAKRVGDGGRVIAFEPDPKNAAILKEHIRLNGIQDRVELVEFAVGDSNGSVHFQVDAQSESHVTDRDDVNSREVQCVTLDRIIGQGRVDVLKIDVEGYEEKVLRGASDLLNNPDRCPRTLYIEVHPFAWSEPGTTSESLLGVLRDAKYAPSDLSGNPVTRVEHYGELIAHKQV